jgi:DNA-directed RNA polymerase specialized sigma24 family protein
VNGSDAVAVALEGIEGEARLVLALLFIEGLNEAEAAAALDRPVAHVRRLATIAQGALAAAIAGVHRRVA